MRGTIAAAADKKAAAYLPFCIMAYEQQQNQNSQWASGLFDVFANGAPNCIYTIFCQACAFADLKTEFLGDGSSWLGAMLVAFICKPIHVCCIHPELRRQIAIKHGKNVGPSLSACVNAPCCQSHTLAMQVLANTSCLPWQQQNLQLTRFAAR
jgi:hypothetical protein